MVTNLNIRHGIHFPRIFTSRFTGWNYTAQVSDSIYRFFNIAYIGATDRYFLYSNFHATQPTDTRSLDKLNLYIWNQERWERGRVRKNKVQHKWYVFT